jgi:dCTP deaminase
MSFLSREDLQAAVIAGDLQVDPLTMEGLGPASITLTIGPNCLALFGDGATLVDRPETYPKLQPRHPDAEGYVALRPGEVLLAPTRERIALGRGLCGWLSGTSDLARLGVLVELSHFVAPGFGLGAPGVVTLELACLGGFEVRLRAGMRVGHLAVARLNTPTQEGYEAVRNGYAGAKEVVASQLHQRQNRRPLEP